MIKSSVCFLFPTPRGRNAMSLQSADGQTASHWSALLRGMLSLVCMCISVCARTCVYVHYKWVLCVLLFHCSYSLLIPSFFPLPHSFQVPVAATWSCHWCVLSPRLQLEVGVKHTHTLTHMHKHTQVHVENWKSQAFAWYLYILSSSSSSSFSSSLPPHLTGSDPQCTACAFICAEVAWSYIIHGSCDLRRVSYGRSNKMEYWWGYDEHNAGERDTSLPLLLPRMALFAPYTHVGERHSFDLYWNGWPRMGQHNRCCFETTDTIPVNNIF